VRQYNALVNSCPTPRGVWGNIGVLTNCRVNFPTPGTKLAVKSPPREFDNTSVEDGLNHIFHAKCNYWKNRSVNWIAPGVGTRSNVKSAGTPGDGGLEIDKWVTNFIDTNERCMYCML